MLVDRRARGAVMALFAVNGATYNSLVPRFPALRDGLGLSNAELGTAIAAFPAAALVFGVLAGPLIARFGSGRVAAAVSLLGAVLLPLVALAPGWWALAAALFVLGLTDAWTDAGMNAQGLVVQDRYGRSIINGLHATWSVAAVGAGLLGAGAAGLGVPIGWHLGAVAVVLVVTSAVAWVFTVPDSAGHVDAAAGVGMRSVLRSRPAVLGLLAIAGLMVCSGAVEDSSASWGAVYLRDDLGAGAFVAGLPFVAFQVFMTAGRLGGDRVVDRFGAVRIARFGALVAAVALAVALLVAHPVAAVAGWAVAGLGVATLFPLAFAAAGTVPGVRPGDGIAVVGFLARLGFLVTPPVIGAIADVSSVGTGLLLVPVAALGAAVLARSLRA
ncbi:MFS transporter [Actinomycetospora sp. NBRC 106378]|uniref:MFS transporter n=1 Tax=Actinomycetospora sp. NBRC 106378 TaxID=3032208 RepID=UPI0024A38211|nr:MFS transporter [Actinomycetospora sp. NBRC 106378]GLZ51065.1 MFS transporter [Actinomycetospora sp. NBRC 106378]